MTRIARLTRLVLLAWLVQTSLATPAQAYLDPGSGSFIFQAIVAALVSGLVTIKLYWRRVRAALRRDDVPEVSESSEAKARESG